jgi:hypothetical protein
LRKSFQLNRADFVLAGLTDGVEAGFGGSACGGWRSERLFYGYQVAMKNPTRPLFLKGELHYAEGFRQ